MKQADFRIDFEKGKGVRCRTVVPVLVCSIRAPVLRVLTCGGPGGGPIFPILRNANLTTSSNSSNEFVSAERQRVLKKRTVTNLHNQGRTWLDLARNKLDAAVFTASGWDVTLGDEDILPK
jgi:hypothetical protein